MRRGTLGLAYLTVVADCNVLDLLSVAAVVVAVLHSLVDLRGNLVALLIVQRMDRFVPGTRLSCHVMVLRKV